MKHLHELFPLISYSDIFSTPGYVCVHAYLCMYVFVCSVPVLGFDSRTALDSYVVLGQISVKRHPPPPPGLTSFNYHWEGGPVQADSKVVQGVPELMEGGAAQTSCQSEQTLQSIQGALLTSQ